MDQQQQLSCTLLGRIMWSPIPRTTGESGEKKYSRNCFKKEGRGGTWEGSKPISSGALHVETIRKLFFFFLRQGQSRHVLRGRLD